MDFNIEEAKQTVKMGKAVYEAMRAVEQAPSGHEQLLFEACFYLDKAIPVIEQLQADIDRMVTQIDEQNEEIKWHRWIPVSERLPETEPYIIVETNRGCYLLAYEKKYRSYRDSLSGLWSGAYIKSITTRWMPIILPEQALKGE